MSLEQLTGMTASQWLKHLSAEAVARINEAGLTPKEREDLETDRQRSIIEEQERRASEQERSPQPSPPSSPRRLLVCPSQEEAHRQAGQ